MKKTRSISVLLVISNMRANEKRKGGKWGGRGLCIASPLLPHGRV